MNPLLLHPLFLEFRRRRKDFLTVEVICRPRGKPQDDFAGELKDWLFSSADRRSSVPATHGNGTAEEGSSRENSPPVWMVRPEEGAFLSGRFTLAGGIWGWFSLETPESDCLGFELVDSSGRRGLIPLPEGHGATYLSLWQREHS